MIKDGFVRQLLTAETTFLLPSYALQEIEKYRVEICRRTELTHKNFVFLLEKLLQRMNIVSQKTVIPYFEKAAIVIDDIDPNDIHFIACCLAYPGSVLWSDDKALKEQNAVTILNTKEIKELLTPSE